MGKKLGEIMEKNEVTMKATENSLLPRKEEIDISVEIYRLYRFPKGETTLIKEPLAIVVTDNGHRVTDRENQNHYIPYGWIHLKFKVREGEKSWYYQRVNKRNKKDLLVEEK